MKTAVLALALFLGGCFSLGPSPDQLKAITASPNMKCLRVSSVYGTLTFYDAGQQGLGDVLCGPDGFISKQAVAPTEVKIPMAITPQFSIAPVQGITVPAPPPPPPLRPESPPRNVPRTPIVPKAPMP